MSWKDRLVTASFRGIDFLTESHDAKGGKRLVLHEYPGSDNVVVEDFGARAWDWKLNAYFIGPDYDLERADFLAKLAEPGATWLTHPWLGEIWARAKEWSLHESNDKGGYCSVSIEFVPGGGEAIEPVVDAVDLALDRTQAMGDAAVAGFSLLQMTGPGFTAFCAEVSQRLEVLRQAISLTTLPLSMMGNVTSMIYGLKGDIATLMATPDRYAASFQSLANALGGADADDVDDTARPRIVARLTSSALASGGPVAAASDKAAVRANLAQESALRGRLLVVSAAQIALADYRSADDRDAALSSVVSAIDALLPAMRDDMFQAAVSARTALIDALMAQDLQPTTYRDVAGPMPAIVLAHKLNVDESVFMARNAVRHPLFVRGRVYG